MPTEYTDSKGVVTPIAELNNFHLVNALLKVTAGFAQTAEIVDNQMKDALKAEVLKRLAPPAQA